jgi:CheY-like chemotaxis protein
LAASPRFDAILMDVQMPDIDGFEATRRIHAEPRLRTTPIIAMTANAMESDKADCRAAGMCDHVGKPIDLEQLITTILRHTGQPPFAAAAVIDSAGVIARMGGSEEFYQTVVSVFRKDAVAQCSGLVQALAQADHVTALRCVHTLKGLAATVGATSLTAAASHMEALLKRLNGNGPDADTPTQLALAFGTTGTPAVAGPAGDGTRRCSSVKIQDAQCPTLQRKTRRRQYSWWTISHSISRYWPISSAPTIRCSPPRAGYKLWPSAPSKSRI